MSVENCSNCAFGIDQSPFRQCRKRAPIVYHGVTGGYSVPTGGEGSIHFWKDTYGEVTAWPRVKDTDFCGEFELKDAP